MHSFTQQIKEKQMASKITIDQYVMAGMEIPKELLTELSEDKNRPILSQKLELVKSLLLNKQPVAAEINKFGLCSDKDNKIVTKILESNKSNPIFVLPNCLYCSKAVTHVEFYASKLRGFCEKCTPWSGHYEEHYHSFKGDSEDCTLLLKALILAENLY